MGLSPTPFPPTRWTLLQKLREGAPADAQAALETLCRAYWTPLYAAARFRGMSEHDAQDAVQGFFECILRRETLNKAEEQFGKLRNLLLRSFENFCFSLWRRQGSAKRGGGLVHLDLMDTVAVEQRFARDMESAELSVEKLYNREWARSVLERSLSALRARYEEKGLGSRFTALERPLLKHDEAESLETYAVQAGMTTGAFRTALHRMRTHYREEIERELAVTLDTDDTTLIREETLELFRAFD